MPTSMVMRFLGERELERKWIMTIENNKSKVEAAKTQLSWRMLGRQLVCDIPGVTETVSIDIDTVHESWADFIKCYGIKQWISSANAKNSFKISDELKIAIIEAQGAAAKAVTDEERKLTAAVLADLEGERTALRLEAVKVNSGAVKTMVFNMMKSLKEQKSIAEKAERETKAQIEARVKAEMLEKMKVGFEAMGLSESQIAGMLANL